MIPKEALKELFILVRDMREQQRTYFKTRSKTALQSSKYLEKKVDAEIEKLKTEFADDRDVNPKPPTQLELPL